MEILLIILIVGALLTYSSLMGGLVLYKFWVWFVLPVFTELPEISFGQAVGLMFVISLFKATSGSSKDEDGSSLIMVLASPPLMLVIGAIAHSLIY